MRSCCGTNWLGCGLAFVFSLRAVVAEAEELPAREFAVMGTVARVVVGASEKVSACECERIARSVFEEIEADLSLYRTNSQLSRLNAAAGLDWVPVGPHLRRNLELAVQYAGLSEGAFDVTIGPLVRLWGFSGGPPPPEVPSDAAIQVAREKIGMRHLQLGEGKALLAQRGMVVDLGGIAKGYAVDLCWEALRQRGARDFLVDLGGNIRVSGTPETGHAWRVGVRNPFVREGGILGKVEMSDGMAIATAGNYERFVTINGKRYSHIIDPRSGRPAEGMASVTVMARTATEADGLDTGLYVLGPGEAGRVLCPLTNCAALFVPDRQPLEMLATPNFASRFVPEPAESGTRGRSALWNPCSVGETVRLSIDKDGRKDPDPHGGLRGLE